jgi:hypothetical protein
MRWRLLEKIHSSFVLFSRNCEGAVAARSGWEVTWTGITVSCKPLGMGAGNQTWIFCRSSLCSSLQSSLSSSRWDLHPVRASSLGVRLTALACGFVVLCSELVLVAGCGEAFYKLVPPQLLSSKLWPVWILDTNKLIFTFFPLYPWAYKADFFLP